MTEIQGKFKVHNDKKYINYPTQVELSQGWEVYKPKKKFVRKINKETKQVKYFKQYFYNEVTLDRLPPKIWNRVNPYSVYGRILNDDFYKFTVKKTDDDLDIIMLHRMIHKQNLDEENIKKLYNSLTEKGYNGWVLIKAKDSIDLIMLDNLMSEDMLDKKQIKKLYKSLTKKGYCNYILNKAEQYLE